LGFANAKLMNLLEKQRWNNSFPWGTIVNPGTDKEICLNEKLVTYHPDGSVHFDCSNALCAGWKVDKEGNIVQTTANWSIGAIVAKEECRTHFGTYYFEFRLPDFRGSWPAIWLIDLHPEPPNGDGMGIPPEIDIFEHFRKDGFLTRFHITHSFHQGPTYQNNTIRSKKYWKPIPLDIHDIEISFTWTATGMTWVVNGKKIMSLPSVTPKYPARPMNLIINSGLGLDWKPQIDHFSPFIVKKAEYHPLI
jgi:hypothetical protein